MSRGSAVAAPPSSIGALQRAERKTRIPHGRNTSASAATLRRVAGVRICALALTLFSATALMPIDALARA